MLIAGGLILALMYLAFGVHAGEIDLFLDIIFLGSFIIAFYALAACLACTCSKVGHLSHRIE